MKLLLIICGVFTQLKLKLYRLQHKSNYILARKKQRVQDYNFDLLKDYRKVLKEQ